MSLRGITSLKGAIKGVGPMVGGVGAVGGFIADVLRPIFALAPFLFFLSIVGSALIYIWPFRTKIKKLGVEGAFASTLGGGFILSCSAIVVFGILSILYLKAPPEGFAASEFEMIRDVQASLFHLEKDISEVSGKIEKTAVRLEDLRQRIAHLSKKGGIIGHPKSDADFFHNAKMYQLGGNMQKARESWEGFLSLRQIFVDAHSSYQSILNNTEGKAKTHEVYGSWTKTYPTLPTIQLFYAKTLGEYAERLLLLKKVVTTFPDFAPGFLEYGLEIISPGYGALSPEESATYAKAFTRYEFLRQAGELKPFVIDVRYIEESQDKVKEALTMWDNFGSLRQPEAVMQEIKAIQTGQSPKF